MPKIHILDSGRLDSRDSAFPMAVQLPDGDILCSFSVGGGPEGTGGTDWARSTDGGRTWKTEGTILQPTEEPYSTNALKLTLSTDGKTVFAYGARSTRRPGVKFGEGVNEAVFCRSTDGGRTWSKPQTVPMSYNCPLEISYGLVVLPSGRLLAPAATLPSQDRLGESVVVAISDDGGLTWPAHSVVFQDPDKNLGYFEQKFTVLGQVLDEVLDEVLDQVRHTPGEKARVMGVCWTVTLGDVVDQNNSFTISEDSGQTWSKACSTGIQGQTMTPIYLGTDRLLVLYNRRYGRQGVIMSLITFTDQEWEMHFEDMMYDAHSNRVRPQNIACGVEEFDNFAFGFPTAIRLRDGSYLVTHWCREEGKFGIRWTKLRIEW